MGKKRCSLGFLTFLFSAIFCANVFASGAYVCVDAMNYRHCAKGHFRTTTGNFINGVELFACTECPTGCTCAGGDQQPVCTEEPKEIEITYNINSASGIEGIIPTVKKCIVGKSCTLEALIRPGYAFRGWSEDAKAASGVKEYTPTDEQPVTLYAIWAQCQAGTYSKDGVCVDADAGYYVPDAEMSEQLPCEGNTYSDTTGARVCLTCEALGMTLGADSQIKNVDWDATMTSHDSKNGCQFVFDNAPIDGGHVDSVSCRVSDNTLLCSADTQNVTCDAGFGVTNTNQGLFIENAQWTDENTGNICAACGSAEYTDANVCVACPGSYTHNQSTGLTGVTQCQTYIEPGDYVATPGGEPQACPNGYYCPGNIVLNYGEVAWNNVPMHEVDDNYALVGERTAKGVGAYSCNDDIHALHTINESLTFTSDAGQSAITGCYVNVQAGKYLGYTEQDDWEFSDCKAGTFSSTNKRSYYNTDMNISTTCDVCGSDAYQPNAGQTSCDLCPSPVPYKDEYSMTRTDDRLTCTYQSAGTITLNGGNISDITCILDAETDNYVCSTKQFSCDGGRYYDGTVFDEEDCYYEGDEYYCTDIMSGDIVEASLVKSGDDYYLYNDVTLNCAAVTQSGEYSPKGDIERHSCADFNGDRPAYSEDGAETCTLCPQVADTYSKYLDKYYVVNGKYTSIDNCAVQFKTDMPISIDDGKLVITDGCQYNNGGYNDCSTSVSGIKCNDGYYNTAWDKYSCEFGAQDLKVESEFAPVCDTTGSNADEAVLIDLSTLGQNTWCEQAPKGQFAYNDMLLTCPAGTYQSSVGATGCILAQPGYYVPNAGMSEQSPCTGNTYSENPAATQCSNCPAVDDMTVPNGATVVSFGYDASSLGGEHTSKSACTYKFNVSIENGTLSGIECSANGKKFDNCTYTDKLGILCDAGYGVDLSGYDDLDDWLNTNGMKFDYPDLTEYTNKTGWCAECPQGSYSTGDGALCQQCNGEHETSNADRTGCQCEDGYGYLNGICTANIISCKDGEYLPAGTTQCEPCKAGSFCQAANYTFNPNEDQGLQNCNDEIRKKHIIYEDVYELVTQYDYLNFTSDTTAKDITDCYVTVQAGQYLGTDIDEWGERYQISGCRGQMYNDTATTQYYGSIVATDNCAQKCPNGAYTHGGNSISVPGITGVNGQSCDLCPQWTGNHSDKVNGYYINEDYGCMVQLKVDIPGGQNIVFGWADGTISYTSTTCDAGYWLHPHSEAAESCDPYASIDDIIDNCNVCKEVDSGYYGPGGVNPDNEDIYKKECPNGYKDGSPTAATESECAYRLSQGEFIKQPFAKPVKCEAGDWCPGGELVYYGQTGGNYACAKSDKYAMFADLSPKSAAGASSPEQCYIDVAINQYVDMTEDKYSIQTCPAGTQGQMEDVKMFFGDAGDDASWGPNARCGTCPNGTYSETAGGVCIDCPAGSFCNSTSVTPYSCADVTGNSNATSPARSDTAEDCYIECKDMPVINGTAKPLFGKLNWSQDGANKFVCRFETGISVNKNPCKIQLGLNEQYICIETSCAYNQTMGANGCEPCDVENAETYLNNGGNCVVATCKPGFHPDADRCVGNTVDCTSDAPYAESAQMQWNDNTGAFGQCIITKCEEGYHLVANMCQLDEQVCTLPHGVGTQVWNHETNAWGKCIATRCDPGFTNDARQTSAADPSQCGACANMYDTQNPSVIAVSSYISECEIATCMYHNEKYALENNQCTQICVGEDETGRRHWDEKQKKCIHECEPGYTTW